MLCHLNFRAKGIPVFKIVLKGHQSEPITA